MGSIIVGLLVGVTSLAAFLFGVQRLGLPASQLGNAGRRVLEGLGLAVVFFASNLAVGVLSLLSIRALKAEFVSAYVLNDVTIVIFSLLQGLAFQWWWNSSIIGSLSASALRDDRTEPGPRLNVKRQENQTR